MGIFDGFLICSDIDGTFTGNEGVSEANTQAVKYFTQNGGKFTFTTGRMATHLIDYGFSDIINAPACICNGAVIYDYESKRVLSETYMDFTVKEFLDEVNEKLLPSGSADIYYTHDASGIVRYIPGDRLDEDKLYIKPLKVVCRFETVRDADEFKSYAQGCSMFKNSYISKSWSYGVEFNLSTATKGHALDFIKKYLGNIHTAIGIGDYENDVPLLKHADIGVAVGNALDEVKQAADMVIKSNNGFAVKNLIEILEKRQEG